jgi:uncharacterized protein
MKVIVDTNVIVSAALKDRKPEMVILFVAERAEFEWLASPAILDEYIGVLHRPKFNLSKDLLKRWESIFNTFITIVEVQEEVQFPRDQKDAKFLTCAIATHAEYLITGDKDFDQAYKVVNTTVLSVSLFKKLVCEKW